MGAAARAIAGEKKGKIVARRTLTPYLHAPVKRDRTAQSMSGPVTDGGLSACASAHSNASTSGTHPELDPDTSPSTARTARPTSAGSGTPEIRPSDSWPHSSGGDVTRYSRQAIGRSAWIEQDSFSRNGQGRPSRK